MPALLTSTFVVALAEVGDKTQLLSLVLAARFRRPLPIIGGILVATLANHALAAWLGAWVAGALGPEVMRWLLGLSFVAIALWALRPDELTGQVRTAGSAGVFVAALIAFFLAEIGDKTQLATVALAAKYDALQSVVLGTTLGMMVANVPVVFFGERIVRRLPMRIVRWLAAGVFLTLAVVVLVVGSGSGVQ
jgi:putative Ca2+/H+ antiporter (TMEM165/GDT1 family)